MNYKITRYENYGEGFKKVFESFFDDRESKIIVESIEENGHKRIKGSGIIGLSYEGITEDKMGKVQITIERVGE